MTKSPYIVPEQCGYCGGELESDACYMGRKYHKYKPFNCGQRHNSFNSKVRKGLASDSEFVIRFCKWATNQIKAGIVTEFQLDPLMNLVLKHKFLPLIVQEKKKK